MPTPSTRNEIVAQHLSLDRLFDEARQALEGSRSEEEAGDALAALREALEVHFDQEDRLYYPQLQALRPELANEVLAIATAHERFRASLAELQAHLERDPPRAAAAALDELAREFARHEHEEEGLLARVEGAAADR